jgi:hypothetical protein
MLAVQAGHGSFGDSVAAIGKIGEWWQGLTTRGKVIIVVLSAFVFVILFNAGVFDSPKMRDCMSFSKREYELARGGKPDAEQTASLKRVCNNLIDAGLWK